MEQGVEAFRPEGIPLDVSDLWKGLELALEAINDRCVTRGKGYYERVWKRILPQRGNDVLHTGHTFELGNRVVAGNETCRRHSRRTPDPRSDGRDFALCSIRGQEDGNLGLYGHVLGHRLQISQQAKSTDRKRESHANGENVQKG